jgi:hypothetical protein
MLQDYWSEVKAEDDAKNAGVEHEHATASSVHSDDSFIFIDTDPFTVYDANITNMYVLYIFYIAITNNITGASQVTPFVASMTTTSVQRCRVDS